MKSSHGIHFKSMYHDGDDIYDIYQYFIKKEENHRRDSNFSSSTSGVNLSFLLPFAAVAVKAI